MRLEPVMTEEFKSCLFDNKYKSKTLNPSPYGLPKYGPFDAAREMYSLYPTDIKQLVYRPHVKLNLELHPKPSLDHQVISHS